MCIVGDQCCLGPAVGEMLPMLLCKVDMPLSPLKTMSATIHLHLFNCNQSVGQVRQRK